MVFNQHGTEILTSYSSESLYLLDPKQNISQERSEERLNEHRKEKLARANVSESKPTPGESPTSPEKRTSQFKRLRLRGDWSDTGMLTLLARTPAIGFDLHTGPDSRPMHEQQSESTTTTASNTTGNTEQQSSTDDSASAAEQQPATRSRHLQNFFMQRMSDILTQLVAGIETNNEEAEQAAPPSTTDNPTPAATASTEPASDVPAPAVEESPASNPTASAAPSTEETTATTANPTEIDTESENSQDVCAC